MTFEVRWLEVARDQYLDLPAQNQDAVVQRIRQLQDSPNVGAYDAVSDQRVTDYGAGTGLLLCAVVEEPPTVIVLRIL
jgi:mRNA-degrading endonuclease RelE of RelBE toxin-antitoxin system